MQRQRYLKLLSILVVAALLSAVVAGGLALAQGTPPAPVLPQSFWGSVKDASGNPIPSGTVEAWMNGVKQDSIAIVNGQYGGPGGFEERLVVQGTSEDIGKTIEFYVNGVKANETAKYTPGEKTNLNLTVPEVQQPPEDTTPPAVVSTEPVNDATSVTVNKTISVTFSEEVQAGTAYDSIAVKDAAGKAVEVTKSITGKVLGIKPNANLAYSTKYTVVIPAGAVKDLAGNALEQSYTFGFTTEAAPVTPPGGGSGGSGGGSGGGGTATAPSTDKVEKTVQAGKATVAEIPGKVKVEVPAGAVTGANAAVVVEVLGDEKAASAAMPLLSKVVDIVLKNGTLTGKVTITLYFDSSKLGKDQQPVAFYYDEKQSKWVRLEGTVDLDKGTVMVTVDHLTMFAVFAAPKVLAFKDMQGHWAAEAVGRLAGMGVVSGYPDGTFRPDNEISRAEVTAILVRALKLAPGSEQDLKFRDNASIPDWARGVVAAATREGLVEGYPQPDGTVTFEPERPLSRAEMAALVARVLEKELGAVAPAELGFADAAKIPSWARKSVGIAVAKGIVTGYPDNTFRADRPVTRAEAVVMVLRLLDALGAE